jgi:hypothetical protein
MNQLPNQLYKTKRLSRDTINKPTDKTYQSTLTKEDIVKKLEDYVRVESNKIHLLPINTHLRYFTINPKTGEKSFRLGGYLSKIGDNNEYVILTNNSVSWSVQLSNSLFYKKLTPNENYCGLETLNINYLLSNITKYPESDYPAINEIYSKLLEKDNCVLLHTCSKLKKFHSDLLDYLIELFPQFTCLTYNGNGIKLMCNSRKSTIPLAKRKAVNNYGQILNKYFFVDNIHYFVNYSISEVLQILKDDPYHNHSHISIIAGNLASRGISFVSSDYSLHLTDQYFVPGKKTHGENYLQSLRILGCYQSRSQLTLWCSRSTWKAINEHNKIINDLVKTVSHDRQWITNIKNVFIHPPRTPLTRLSVNPRIRKISRQHFALE